MKIPIDEAYLTKQIQALVQIDSINPDLEKGAAGEGAIANYVAQALTEIGITPQIQKVEGDRKNVLGVLKGTGNGKSLLLNAHLDTVGITGMAAPFSGTLQDGKIYGRGAYDMKASIAAMLAVMKGFVESGHQLAGDLWFTTVIDEEYGSKGMEHLVKHLHTDAAILTEPTQLRVCCAHRGFVWIEVKTQGRAAHGSRYNEGIDANMHMGRVLVELEKLSQALVQRTGHPLLGPPSMHAPLIQGGTSQSVYAAFCRVELERRILPGETVDAVVTEVQAVIDKLAAADPQFHADVKALFNRNAYEIAPNAPIVKTVQATAQQVLSTTPELYGEVWWMDSALLGEAGIDTVIIGPSGGGIHADEEWVEVESVVQLAHILAQSAISYCK
ncbi:ArgE/DapE family deacylase [Phototrophicus methaneseepsis]|uniref:Probable succinyl-diaminopimelate desuccinylase n=1 Tax=Phototrophicus methaneseepsis TaxID=2710758 RepID=A0A7S8E6Q1_9CHLR|nr:ArgE/DapE family deacylase [Phototrophicus methaneseepsis]QPC81334.1 ArgE/DapE family deacylase [Phototrophicus methaneseepsis]